jgi:hypothetical protein
VCDGLSWAPDSQWGIWKWSAGKPYLSSMEGELSGLVATQLCLCVPTSVKGTLSPDVVLVW